MTLTAHALVGGAMAASIHNPVLGLLASNLSHPLLDMIPHWDEGWGWRKKTKVRLVAEGLIDLSIGVILAYFLFGSFTSLWYLLGCIFMAVSWDLLQGPYLIWDWKFPPFSWMYQLQHSIQGKAALPWGIVTQVATVMVVIFLLGLLPKF